MRKRFEETAEMWELREMERAEREREGDIAARGLRGCEGGCKADIGRREI